MVRRKQRRYRSKLEKQFADKLRSLKLPIVYETLGLKYTLPERTYTPDFIVGDVIIEVKGVLDRDARLKMLTVKEQHPHLDIRFVLQKPKNKVPGLKMRHWEWCEKHGFKWTSVEEFSKKWLLI